MMNFDHTTTVTYYCIIMKLVELGGVGVDHALKFWDRYNHCAVFVLVHHGKPECEIYVWEDHIAFNVTRCEDVYKQYCPRWHYAPFSRHCRP
uniref:Lipocalin n=1 Tax=Rhipicephalus zambeziensis TaxID=60191 RepID=A0A224YCM5_9ACAR